MKVKELIEQLDELDPEAEVILQKDSEGNGYSPCVGAESCIYIPESTWDGQVYNKEDLDKDEEADTSKQVAAVVLWPVN